MVGGEFQSLFMKDGVVFVSIGEIFWQKSWLVFVEDEWYFMDVFVLIVGSCYEYYE